LKFLAWGILLAVIGGWVGWALRALTARRDLARARADAVEPDELERMRHRLADLEQVVAERDRLRMQIADMRHTDSPGVVGAVPDDDPQTASPLSDDGDVMPADGPPRAVDDAAGKARHEAGPEVEQDDAEIPRVDAAPQRDDRDDDGSAESDDVRNGGGGG
jgi:hypothetical protein